MSRSSIVLNKPKLSFVPPPSSRFVLNGWSKESGVGKKAEGCQGVELPEREGTRNSCALVKVIQKCSWVLGTDKFNQFLDPTVPLCSVLPQATALYARMLSPRPSRFFAREISYHANQCRKIPKGQM